MLIINLPYSYCTLLGGFMKFSNTPELLHFLLKRPVRFYLNRKFNIHVLENEIPKNSGPFFLIGHHVTAFDAVIAGAYAPKMIRFIAGDANYDNKIKKFFMNLVGAVPFSKNTSDIKSVMKLKKLSKAGKSVSLYPEGGRNWDGSTDRLIPSTSKLIKLLRVPVYTIFYKGGYLSKPRWGQYFRKGKIEVSIKLLLSPEQLKTMSAQMIQQAMVDGLNYNEYHWQRENMIPFKGKHLAEHVERLVYKCPNCEAHDTFVSKGNDFTCSNCQIKYSINQFGFIDGCSQFDNLSDWNQWQHSFIPELYENGFEFSNQELLIDIIHKKTNTHNKQICSMTLTKEELILSCQLHERTFPIKSLKGISVSFLDVLELHVGEHKYRFQFKAGEHTSLKLFYDMLRYTKAQIPKEE